MKWWFYPPFGLKKVRRTFLFALRNTLTPEKFSEFFDPPPRGGWDQN